jgi:hypothetical protein
MKQIITVGLIAAMFFTSSCVKDHHILPKTFKGETKLLAEANTKFPAGTSQTRYRYNKNKSLANFTSGDFENNYQYKGKKINYSITQLSINKKIYELELTLNNNGLMVEGKGQLLYNPAAPIPFTVTYEYTSDGYLAKQTINQQNRVLVKEFTYTGDNLTMLKYYDTDKLKYTVTYSYDKVVENKFNVIQFADFPVPANGFSGKTSKHLWTYAKQVNTDGQKGHTNKEFTIDADGYPTSCIFKSSNITFTESYSFSPAK